MLDFILFAGILSILILLFIKVNTLNTNIDILMGREDEIVESQNLIKEHLKVIEENIKELHKLVNTLYDTGNTNQSELIRVLRSNNDSNRSNLSIASRDINKTINDSKDYIVGSLVKSCTIIEEKINSKSTQSKTTRAKKNSVNQPEKAS